jgi:2-oxo-3-hexenedioate decarboxylase
MSVALDKNTLNNMALKIDEAAMQANSVSQLSQETPFSLKESYEIQRISIEQRLNRGEQLVGYKLGFTSRAKMIQMGVDDLIWGRLTDSMIIEEGGEINLDNYVHPRVEPEIAFLMKKPLSGKVTTLEALSAVEAVAPALEVIDSRYQNFKFSLEDVIADNCSSSGFAVGTWHAMENLGDLSNLGMIMQINGDDSQIGSSAAILGNPVRSLISAARCLGEFGESLLPGQILMAGASTAAVALEKGSNVSLLVDRLGQLDFKVSA